MEWLNYLSFSDGGWGDELLSGLGVTLSLAVATLPVGLLLGLLVAAVTIFGRPIPRALAVTFTTTIRGLPELLTLFIIYHGVGLGINSLLKWYSPQSSYFELSPFLAGVLALGMVFGGYASEVLRGAWQALDHGQLEAAQALGVTRELQWDMSKVNVNGGAIALGHPIGASGCRVLVTLLHEMQRRDAKKGLATLCIGGGMGVALAVERA